MYEALWYKGYVGCVDICCHSLGRYSYLTLFNPFEYLITAIWFRLVWLMSLFLVNIVYYGRHIYLKRTSADWMSVLLGVTTGGIFQTTEVVVTQLTPSSVLSHVAYKVYLHMLV